MNWKPHMEVHYINTGLPYSSTGSSMDFFEGLTYEHVNFIFADTPYAQTGSVSYNDCGHSYTIGDHTPCNDEYNRHMENLSSIPNDKAAAMHTQRGGISSHINPPECPRSRHNARDYQAVWQDNVDPDTMTYEELLELGEAVGTQSRGLSQELISLLPISKFKCGFFWRKKSRDERCVICQMEYKRRDLRITLPCKHIYHAACGSRWLSINKACPICYKEVFSTGSKLQ